jgi:hypothetical protein
MTTQPANFTVESEHMGSGALLRAHLIRLGLLVPAEQVRNRKPLPAWHVDLGEHTRSRLPREETNNGNDGRHSPGAPAGRR